MWEGDYAFYTASEIKVKPESGSKIHILWGLYGNKFFHFRKAECYLLREGKVLAFDSRYHRLSTYI